MPHEQWCFTRRAVLQAVAALACGVSIGCSDDMDLPPPPGKPAIIGSVHIIGEGMYGSFERMRESLTKEDRDILEEEIFKQKDLLVHTFLATGRLPPDESRGGAAEPASSEFMKQVCDFHPIVGKFARKRDWDVVYDPECAEWFKKMHGIPNPPEVVLYHEFFGHLIPCLRDPKLMGKLAKDKSFKMEKECEALDIENRYRRQIKLPEVPRKLIECPSPKE